MKELALHMLDIAENGIAAGATRIILGIEEEKSTSLLKLWIEDNGKGMDNETLSRTADPFFTTRTTRKQGLGIPLFRQHAELTGGSMNISSIVGEGTRVNAVFDSSHPDIQPLGDIEGCWLLLASMNPGIDIVLKLYTENGEFQISSSEVRELLDTEEIKGQELSSQLKRLIRNNIEEIGLT